MKKFMLLAVAVGAFTFTSCSSDDDSAPDCQQLMENYSNAMQAYNDDASDENCAAWDAAAEAYQNSECQGSEAVMMCPDGN